MGFILSGELHGAPRIYLGNRVRSKVAPSPQRCPEFTPKVCLLTTEALPTWEQGCFCPRPRPPSHPSPPSPAWGGLGLPYRHNRFSHQKKRGCWPPQHREVAAATWSPSKATVDGKFRSPDPLQGRHLFPAVGGVGSRGSLLLQTCPQLESPPAQGAGRGTVLPEGPSS